MKLSEAYSTLNISENASQEEAKKAFKKKAAVHHPDNKSTGSETEFKKINEAYECIKSGKGSDPQDRMPNSPSWGYRNPFGQNPFYQQRQQVVQLEHVEMSLTISFKEAVLGCKKEIKYSRQAKCQSCDGAGETKLNNGCKKCGGKGNTAVKNGNMVFVTNCTSCQGRSSTEDCKACHGEGSLFTDVSIHVSVPAGILNGNTLRLQGMGNYAGSVMGIMDQYTDGFCHIEVEPSPDLSIDGNSVVFNLTLSLLEAIQGCNKSVNTIHGSKEIQVPPQSRNKDEIIIPHFGVGGSGDQRVILDVQYPKDIDLLISNLIEVGAINKNVLPGKAN